MSEHLVHFYEGSTQFADTAAGFFGAGLAAGDAVVVIATSAHREELDRRLSGRTTGAPYVALDAATTLSRFLVGGLPDEGRFRDVVGAAITEAGHRGGGRVRAVGEMVALLALEGNWEAAVCLEDLWNALIRESPLSLLCAYPESVFANAAPTAPFETICAQHTHVVPTGGRQRIRFASLIERAVAAARPLTDARRHVVTVVWPDHDLHVEGDRARLEEVVAKVVEHAATYTPHHGRIDVSAFREGRYAVLRVRDSGAAIVPGVLPAGSGIMALRGVVEMYGGVVEVQAGSRSRGAEFVVRLPVAAS